MDKSPINVLVVHSQPEFIEACRTTLEKHGYAIESAKDGNEGIERVYAAVPDLVICGASVPELNGYQFCRLVKNDPVTKKIPIILVSEVDEKMDRFWSIKAGADDFLYADEIRPNLLKKATMLLDIYGRIGIQDKDKLKASLAKSPFNVRARLNQIMDASLVESTLMVEFRGLSDLVHDVSLLNYMLFSLMESIIEYDAAAIFYNDESKGPRTLTFHLPDTRPQPTTKVENLMDTFFERIRTVDRNGTQPFDMLESEVIGALDEEAEPAEFQTAYMKEMIVDGKLIGALALYSRDKVDYSSIFPMSLIEDELRLLMKLRHLYSQAELLALTDSQTGLFNHKHFMMTLQREFKSSRRYELDLSLAVICVDNFKQLNEELGHDCGDEILRHVSRIAEACFRSVDVPARFAGNQLAIIFPKTPIEPTLIAIERFKNRIAESPLQWEGESRDITISAGIVTMRSEMENISQLIKQAEETLMAARKSGGNRIEISVAKR